MGSDQICLPGDLSHCVSQTEAKSGDAQMPVGAEQDSEAGAGKYLLHGAVVKCPAFGGAAQETCRSNDMLDQIVHVQLCVCIVS